MCKRFTYNRYSISFTCVSIFSNFPSISRCYYGEFGRRNSRLPCKFHSVFRKSSRRRRRVSRRMRIFSRFPRANELRVSCVKYIAGTSLKRTVVRFLSRLFLRELASFPPDFTVLSTALRRFSPSWLFFLPRPSSRNMGEKRVSTTWRALLEIVINPRVFIIHVIYVVFRTLIKQTYVLSDSL